MAASVMVEPYKIATNESSAAASRRSVTKKFGRQTALDRYSLELCPEEVAALLYTVLFLLAAAFIFRRQEALA